MKSRTGKMSMKAKALTITVAVFLFFCAVGTGAVLLFRSLVPGKADISAGTLGGTLNFSVTELQSGVSLAEQGTTFTLSAAGDSAEFSLVTANNAKENLTLRYFLGVKSVAAAGATPATEWSAAVKSAVLVYFDGVFAGTLASLTENGRAPLGSTLFLPAGRSHTHTVKLVLHSAITDFSGATLSLSVLSQAENADAGSCFFISNEVDFARALDDINSGLLPKEKIPTLVLTAPLSLAADYTLSADCRLELCGHAFDPAGHTLTVTGGTLSVTDTERFFAEPAAPGGQIILNGATALLDIADLSAWGAPDYGKGLSSLVRPAEFDRTAAAVLLAARVRERAGYGLAAGTSADLFTTLSFYAEALAPTADGGTLLAGVFTAPAALPVTATATVTIGAQTCVFKIFGADGETELAALRTGALAHLEALSAQTERITSDLFLPTAVKDAGVTITWTSSDRAVMSDAGKIADEVSDGSPITLFAEVRINERVYTLSYKFAVSSIDNEMRFNNLLSAMSPITLKEVFLGGEESSADFIKSHQFLPNALSNSAYSYRTAYVSPADTTLTQVNFAWNGYENIGLTSLRYAQDTAYNYVSVYENANGEQAVYLNTPVFSTFAQIQVTAQFKGDEKVYSGLLNIMIETGNYEELLDSVFDFVQSRIDEVDLYKNLIRTRMADGMAAERADFSLSSLYVLHTSSLSTGKYSITYTAGESGGVFSAAAQRLRVPYEGGSYQAYTLLDDIEGYETEAVTGAGLYIRVETDAGAFYVSATEAGAAVSADGETVIDGTGKIFLPVNGSYDFSVDLTKAGPHETMVPVTVTVRYTYKPLVQSVRTLYVPVPAVILPDENGFRNQSVFNAVKYQMYAALPEAERVKSNQAFVVSGNKVTNRTPAYILLRDIERCNGAAGNWFEGEYNGAALTIAYGAPITALRFYVGRADTAADIRESRIYDFLALLKWGAGNRSVQAWETISGTYDGLTKTVLPVAYENGGYAALPSGTVETGIVPSAQTENGDYRYYDTSDGVWKYYNLSGAETSSYTLTFNCFTLSLVSYSSYYLYETTGGTLAYTTTAGASNAAFTLLNAAEVAALQNPTDGLTLGTAVAGLSSSETYYLYCPETGHFLQKRTSSTLSMSESAADAAPLTWNSDSLSCRVGTTTYYIAYQQSWSSSSRFRYAPQSGTDVQKSVVKTVRLPGTLTGPYSVYKNESGNYTALTERAGYGTVASLRFLSDSRIQLVHISDDDLRAALMVQSDGKEYLTPEEISALRGFYAYITGRSDFDTVFAGVSITAPGRVITDPEAFGAVVQSIAVATSKVTRENCYFKHTELMRWALNKQNFPESALFGGYPLGNPPNAGELSYNISITAASKNKYYFTQTGGMSWSESGFTNTSSDSLKSGYYNEDSTEYISEREEIILKAYWYKRNATAFGNAFDTYSVVPTYLSEEAAPVFTETLYQALGISLDYTVAARAEDGKLYPFVTGLSGSLAALSCFTDLTELVIAGDVTAENGTRTAGLPAFLHTGSLSAFYTRLQAFAFAGKLTTLTLSGCAQDFVEFDLSGATAFTALRKLDLSMNYGIRYIGPLLELSYKNLTYLDLSGVGQPEDYQEFALNILYNGNHPTLYYTPDANLTENGRVAVPLLYSKAAENSEWLALLSELTTLAGQYLQLGQKIYTEAGAVTLYWHLNSGNTMYPSPVTRATGASVSMASLLSAANSAVGTATEGNYLGMYVYYSGSTTTAYTSGCVYRMVWADDAHTRIVYDDAGGGARTCRSVNGSDFIAAPYGAAEIGGLYYLPDLTENPSFYATDRFYIMTYDEDGGFYYLQTFGTATPLLGTDENGTSNAYLRLKNGRLYLTTGSDYSGTGGTDTVELEAVIRVDGTEYRRIFRITVIG